MLYAILCPVGAYFSAGEAAVSLLADPRFTRSWPGGCGDKKMGSNYAPTILVQVITENHFGLPCTRVYPKVSGLTQ